MNDPDCAELVYLNGDFKIMRYGQYVRCAVSGQKIPIRQLRYWSVDRQEAYASAEISLKREQELQ